MATVNLLFEFGYPLLALGTIAAAFEILVRGAERLALKVIRME